MILRRLGRSWAARIGFSAAMVASVMGVSSPPASAAPLKLPLAVVARDFQFLGVPGRLPAATYDLQFINISRTEEHEFVAVNLGPICSKTITTVAAAKALLDGGQDPDVVCPGNTFEGGVDAGPGGRARQTLTLTPGRTLYFCGVPDENGTPHFDLGMIGFINVFSVPGRF